MIRPLLVAIQFLTILPVRLNRSPNEEEVGLSLIYYPVVGLMMGVLLVLLAVLLDDAPKMMVSAILLATWVWVTGGLHLDGLADSADAWVGGLGDKQKTLEILKDPNCGPAGVAGIVLILFAKFSALHCIVEEGSLNLLLIAPIVSRTILPILFMSTSYVRPGGIGSAIATSLPDRIIILVSGLVITLVIFLNEAFGLMQLFTVVCALAVLRNMALKRIGGITGDVAGGITEIIEAIVLISIALS